MDILDFVSKNRFIDEDFKLYLVADNDIKHYVSNCCRILHSYSSSQHVFGKVTRKGRRGEYWGYIKNKRVNINLIVEQLFGKLNLQVCYNNHFGVNFSELCKDTPLLRHFIYTGEYRCAMNYLSQYYYNSLIWKDVVKMVKYRDNGKCKYCDAYTVTNICHHTSYKNWGKGGFEEANDCVLVCKKCHYKRHIKKGNEPTPFWAKRYLAIDHVSVSL